MLKRFFLTLAIAAGLLSPAFGYGTIPYSLTQQFDSAGHALIGGKLYLIQAGTTSTPQNCYQDTALTIAHPNPITLDSAGRIPQLFCADGSIKIRLENSAGVSQVAVDNILVVGPSGGGGGGSTVDPTTILQTGWIQPVYGTGSITGFVRCNGRTIGNAVSGATERANADTSALFSFLWSADAGVGVLTISGGRGASAAADYAANKTISLPDLRGRAVAGLDDMGNTAAGRLTVTYFGIQANIPGAGGGDEKRTLTLAQIPTGITSGGTTTYGGKSIPMFISPFSAGFTSGASNGVPYDSGGAGNITFASSSAMTATSNNTSGLPHPTVSPMLVTSIYIKL